MTVFAPDQRPRRSYRALLDNPTAIEEAALIVGDVLMVAVELEDKNKKGKTFTWRHFALVTKVFKHQRFVEALVLDDREREPRQVHFYREGTTIHFLPESEWPDGVHALRARVILDGRVDIGLF